MEIPMLFSKPKKVKKSRNENLEKIAQLTAALPEVPGLYDIALSSGGVQRSRFLEVGEGDPIEEWGLLTQKGMAISVCQGIAGSRCVEHVHPNSVEYYIVSRGRVASIQGGGRPKEDVGCVGDVIVIPKNVPHICKIIEDATFVVVNIPAAEGMPISPTYRGIHDGTEQ